MIYYNVKRATLPQVAPEGAKVREDLRREKARLGATSQGAAISYEYQYFNILTAFNLTALLTYC